MYHLEEFVDIYYKVLFALKEDFPTRDETDERER
jgi:hypothetical protein